MAVRGRDADDMIALLMHEMGEQRGYQNDRTGDEEISEGGNIRNNDGKIDKGDGLLPRNLQQQRTSHRRLIPELSNYPDNTYEAGSQSIWNPMVMGNCGSSLAHSKTDEPNQWFSYMMPTNPRIEVIRRRVFEKFRQETQTMLQEFQTKNLSFSPHSSSNNSSSSFSKNKNKLPIPSMIDKWHMDAKLDERNFLLKKMAASKSSNSQENNSTYINPSSTSTFTAQIIREITRIKQQGKHVYDPILLNKHAPSIFVENILKPQVQKMWEQNRQDRNNNSQFPPKFNKKAEQVQRGLFRLICEAIDSFETQLLQDARQESTRSTTTFKSRKGNNNSSKLPKISRTPIDDDPSSASLVRVTFSGVSLKLHPAYLEKLQRLYDRTKERRQQRIDPKSSSDIYLNLSFEEALFCLLCRYDMIQGSGLQAGVPGAIMDALLKRFDCRMECFASPLNCRYDKFASAFVDVDAPFGSQGSFFELPFSLDDGECDDLSGGNDDNDNDSLSSQDRAICYEANPPFCEGLILQLSDKIERVLTPQLKQRPIMFVVFVPAWRESECYQALLTNDRLTQHLILKQGEHWYAEGTQHRRKDSFRVASFDTSILFYQNEPAKKLWNLQSLQGKENIILDELTKAFGQDPGTMQKDHQIILNGQNNGTVKSTILDASVAPALESAVGRASLSTGDRKKQIKNSRTVSSSTRKPKKEKDCTKEKKRKWNQQEEGKAQMDLLASLGLSSMAAESTVTKMLKSDTGEKVTRKKKTRRKM